MRKIDTAAERILSPLSVLLHKDFRLVAGTSDVREEHSVRLPQGDLRLVSGSALTREERDLVREIFDLIERVAHSDAKAADLMDRIQFLERDNIDLTVKNRVLSEISARDALTGLYNRWFVLEKIEAEINRSLRSGSALALMMVDIDHFKNVNDTYGHTAGDLVLQVVGKVLKDSCRVYDVPGRYGGEEFCVVLPDTKLGMTPVVAERIRSRLEMTDVGVGEGSVSVTASIGIAGIESEKDTVLSSAALIDRADRALYAAKRRGRNRIEMWDATLVDSRPVGTEH
jgi:diguanylate cyclase (GGDEF)-like protein